MPVTTPPTVDALPTAPDPNDRSTFNSRAYPWAAALDAYGDQLEALGANVYANAVDAASSATAAAGSASSASTSATAADTAKVAAQLAKTQAEAAVASLPAGTLNDTITATDKAWSSSKVSTELTNERTATATLTNKTISGAVLTEGYTEEVFAVTGTTPVLSPTNGSIQTWTLSANSTPTSGTWAAGQSITLMVADGTAYTITWTSVAVTWVGGTAPTLATSGFTVIVLWKVGSTIYGVKSGEVA